MITNQSRIGNFTSSKIFNLMGTPKAFDTYVKKKRAERALKRSVDLGKQTQPMVWGKICERYLHEYVLGFEYDLCSKETETHPLYAFWSGSPDFIKIRAAVESKCFEPDNYFNLSYDLLLLKEGKMTLSQFKVIHKEVYWQVVSNSIILQLPESEIIAFIPNLEQLMHIRQLVEETDFAEKAGLNLWDVRFISEKPIEQLSYIPEESDYPNMVIYSFEAPQADKDALEIQVLKAESKLTK